ncbi:MAG TPA: hypothetical protein VI489_06400, partial [Candidatus Brocadiaceae bacterium]
REFGGNHICFLKSIPAVMPECLNRTSINDGFPLEHVPTCLQWVTCGNDKLEIGDRTCMIYLE